MDRSRELLETWNARVRHPRLVLLCDLDGTLIPFAPTAEEAELDADAVALLSALQATGVQVVIVSGRPRRLVEPFARLLPAAWWFAEHGAWRGIGNEWTGPTGEASELAELARSLEWFTATPGARIERKSLSVCLHWRGVPAEQKPALIAAAELLCDEWLEARPDHERIPGVEMMEVRARVAHKGSAVEWIREQLPDSTFIAIGDDHTDEDMFAALMPADLGVRVGHRHGSRGTAWVEDPAAVRALLQSIIAARSQPAPALPPAALELVTRPAPSRTRLLVVSNRTPPASTGRERSVGGLVSALEPALASSGGVWLGWSGHEREGAPALVIDDTTRPARAAFDFPRAVREKFYVGLCNRALWPLFHGLPTQVRFADDEWRAYVETNAAYARFAMQLVEPHGTVWAHDYHLLLFARAMRDAGFTGPLGMFLHIPFPQTDLLDTFPWHDELLEGMCAYDVIGVHTQQWADNLTAALRRVHARKRGRALRKPTVLVRPIGIDAAAFAPIDSAPDPDVVGLVAGLGSRRLILGVDRLDQAKGIPERLHAFERMLERWPEWRARVSFVQISVPSRADVPGYAELREHVERLVGRINGRFGEADWVPVRYLYRSYEQSVLAQLYRAADVGLVTPLRDGLNLVAKEFVAAQRPEEPGALVLSRFAGAAAELTDAILTNPYHVDGLAEDLDRALRMPRAERIARHAALAAVVERSTPHAWATEFLATLEHTRPTTVTRELLGLATAPGGVTEPLDVRALLDQAARYAPDAS